MKKFTVFGVIMFLFSYSFATIPPMKGGPLPEKVREHAEMMQSEYANSDLAHIVQKWAADKMKANSSSEIQSNALEQISASFPVLVGKYADAVNVQQDAPQQLQAQLFDGPWPTITMREYYLENSYNQFELDGNVYGWIQAAGPESLYTGPHGSFGMGGYAAAFVRELLDSVDAYVNFADFDNDGNGFVETVMIVHSGPGQEYYGSTSFHNHIWSHSSRLSYYGGYYNTNDVNSNNLQVKIDRYIIQPAINMNGSLISIGVFCHEFGHALGLPDLYDTSYNSEGIGEWGLMGGGSWNSPTSPAHFTAWSREILGWLTPVMVDEDRVLELIPPIESDPVAYKLWYEGSVSPYTSAYGARLNVGRQYFLVENRQQIGSDVHLHAPGVLIWHVDNSVTTGNSNVSHKLVDLEEADGLNHLDNNVNSGDDGDPFPGSTLNQRFDYYSNPNSKAYNGTDSKVIISDFYKDLQTYYANLGVGIIKYEYLSLQFEDSAGNGDGIFDPGEDVHLQVRLRNNTATTADNMRLELVSTNSSLVVTNPLINLGDIASGDSADISASPFVLNIASGLQQATYQLQLRLMVGSDYVKETNLDMVVGVPPFLVLDEDLNKLAVSSFRNWLTMNDYSFEMKTDFESSSEDIHLGRREIIALIGGNNPDALSDTVFQDSLAGWLTSNKRLLIMTPAASPVLANTPFAQNTLGIQYNNSTTNIILKGTAGDPLGVNGGFVFLESGSYEMVNPMGTNVAAIKFNGTTSGGLIYRHDANNNKIVYLSFDPRYVKNSSPVSQDQILSSLISWFEAPTDITPVTAAPVISEYILEQNYPNPFNPRTNVRFHLPAQAGNVDLVIYNELGQQVKIFDTAGFTPGWNEVSWDGTSTQGVPVSSGIYFMMLKSDRVTLSRKIVLLK